MPEKDSITTKFRVEISEFKKGITEANNQIKRANSEFNKASAGMDDWSKSSDGIKAKLVQLESVLEAQDSKLKNYQKQLQIAQKYEEEASESVVALKQALEQAKTAYGTNSSEAKELSRQLTQAEKAEIRLANQVSALTVTMNNQEATVKNTKQEMSALESSLEKVEEAEKIAAKTGQSVDEVLKEMDKSARKSGKGFTVMKGALAELVADGIRKTIDGLKDLASAAVEYESAFTNVKKTVDGSEGQLAKLDSDIRGMAKTMPQSASEIAGVASAAGQLGVATDNISGFTKTMLMLGDSTNLSSEEAATALARFANVTGMGANEYSKLGSTIVALGNNFATTESEIVDMGTRLASAGSQVGLSQPEIMSVGAALSSVGLEAEAGGTAFSRLLIDMQVAAEKGGTSLDQFASVAGMSADEFKAAFQQDAMGALQAFIGGLADSEKNGKSAIGTLDEMGISEVRLRDSILRAVGAKDTFNEAVSLGKTAWEQDTALQNEASQRYETTASKIQIMKNNFTDLGLTLFDKFQPAIQQGVEWLTKLADNEPAITALTGAVGALVAAFAITKLVNFVSEANKAVNVIKGWELVTKAQIAAQGLLNAVMDANPISLVIGAIVLLVAGIAELWAKSEAFRNFWTGVWDSIKTTCHNAFTSISEFLRQTWEGIKERFSSLGAAVGEAIGGAVKSALNAVISRVENTINDAISLINGAIGLINNLPGVNVPKVSEINLPRLQTGIAMAKKGHQYLLEGKNDEAVIPLHKNAPWLKALAGTLLSELKNGNSFVNSNPVNNLTNNNTNNFTQIINAPRQPSRIELYRQTRNLLELKGGNA